MHIICEMAGQISYEADAKMLELGNVVAYVLLAECETAGMTLK